MGVTAVELRLTLLTSFIRDCRKIFSPKFILYIVCYIVGSLPNYKHQGQKEKWGLDIHIWYDLLAPKETETMIQKEKYDLSSPEMKPPAFWKNSQPMCKV